jgi:2-C-methyl-D-erythritol 4-phosphate cytidylyltransferase
MMTAVLVLAAGRGERLGQPIPKAFVALRGRSLLERSLATMLTAPEVDLVQPVVSASDLPRYASLALVESEETMGLCDPVPGGVERQDSVAAGLDALPDEVDLVAVHDAARCLVTVDEVHRVLAEAEAHGAALLATPARDTIKRVRAGEVVETPTRSECWVAQTPQAFHVGLLREAIDKARADGVLGTDDAQLVERLGVPVRVVEGSPRNIKITLPDDLALAERLLMSEEATAR